MKFTLNYFKLNWMKSMKLNNKEFNEYIPNISDVSNFLICQAHFLLLFLIQSIISSSICFVISGNAL